MNKINVDAYSTGSFVESVVIFEVNVDGLCTNYIAQIKLPASAMSLRSTEL